MALDSNTFHFKSSKLGPTINGIKPLLRLNTQQKTEILKSVQKEWKDLIRLHFKLEGGITTTNSVKHWADLSDDYQTYKEGSGKSKKILQLSTPSLSTRYQKGIKYNVKEFSIVIIYPELVTGIIGRANPNFADGTPVTAIVHQLGRIKRPLIKKGFTEIYKRELRKFFTS